MYNEGMKNRIFGKLEAAMRIYAEMIYEKVGALRDTQAYYTKEHLRAVPEEGYAPIAVGDTWGEEWDNLWLRGEFTVPAELDGKPLYAVSGSSF